jgi:carboxylesterase
MANLMPGAEPIFLEGGDIGIIFYHGFTGSPYEGRDFASYFAQKGYSIWVPLLPGHGTRPEELINITWRDWYLFAEKQFLELKKKFKRVILVGQSMGGSLALSLAAHYPTDAVVSLSGAVFLRDWRLKLLPIAKKLLHYQYKSRGPDVSIKEVKKNSASYHKYPIKSIEEFLNLIEFTKKNLNLIKDPLMLIHSQKDHTVTYKNMDYIFNSVSSTIKKKITLRNSYHIISLDQEKTTVFQNVINFLKELHLTP